MGWPQFTYLALTLIGLGIFLAKHGQPRNENYNFFSTMIVQCFIYWVLYMGGFFG